MELLVVHNFRVWAIQTGARKLMRIRLQRDIDKLKDRAITLGAMVEQRFRMAVKAIERRDAVLARSVIDGDMEIDELEVDIEEDCLKMLALHQPVADQLRFIITVLKMDNDLERIGDLAVNIAQRAEFIARSGELSTPFDYSDMCRKTEQMLEKSLDSLVNLDLPLAYEVLSQDDEVDLMKHMAQKQFAEELPRAQHNADALINLFLVSRHLERIADHATNIAEDVIYMITGEIHRHRDVVVIRGSDTWFDHARRAEPGE
jgi:phosphate transport system protein